MSQVILVAIIAAVPGALAAIMGLLNHGRVNKLIIEVNGRLTELLASARKESRATGHREGMAERRHGQR